MGLAYYDRKCTSNAKQIQIRYVIEEHVIFVPVNAKTMNIDVEAMEYLILDTLLIY